MKVRASGLLAAALAVSSIGSALAADMPVKAQPVAPVWSWTGFYAGVHAGYGWGNDDPVTQSFTTVGLPLPLSVGAANTDGNNGTLFGGHVGYNWQMAPNWVIGVEGDFTKSGIHGAGAVGGQFSPFLGINRPGDAFAVTRDVNWLASIRGRIGYAWGSNMLYFTGGAAWADIDYRAQFTSGSAGVGFCATSPPGLPGCSINHTISDTRTGWVIGGGYEGLLAGNWLWRIEYLYYRFDDALVSNVTLPVFTGVGVGCIVGLTCTSAVNFGDLNIQTIRLGVSYKFRQGASGVYAQAPTTAAGGWTGFYAGAHAGYGWGNDDPVTQSFTAVGLPLAPLSVGAANTDRNNGTLFGGHVGYNWQMAPNWVIGVEGDFTKSGIHGAGAVGGQFSPLFGINLPTDAFAVTRDVNWLASIRGRIGYAWGSNMLYFTGGAAWADIDYRAQFTSGNGVGFCFTLPPGLAGCSINHTISDTRTGWVIGGGYEGLLAGNWLWRIEYLYYRFDDALVSNVTLPAFTGVGVGCGAGVPCTSTVNFGDLNIQTVRLGVSYKF